MILLILHTCFAFRVVVYLIIFGFQLEPFLRTRFEVPGVYINDLPVHSCTTNAAQIRDEIETLRHDFNKRFKQLIFTCMLNAYLVLIPCLLSLGVQYNVMRAAQHCIIVCLGAFSLSAVFQYPAKYSDTLHRATLHLGSWQRMDRDPLAAPSQLIVAANAQSWSKYTVYGHGTVVKHNGALYRSHGLVTVATPGNASHLRFYVSKTLFQCFLSSYLYMFVFTETVPQSHCHLLHFSYIAGSSAPSGDCFTKRGQH